MTNRTTAAFALAFLLAGAFALAPRGARARRVAPRPPAKVSAAISIYPQAAQPDRAVTFKGTIGEKSRIQMRLRREGDQLSGTYFYESIKTDLALKGTIDREGNFTLREYDAAGAQTGVFKGKWRVAPDTSLFLNGSWSKPDGKRTLPFAVAEFPIEFGGAARMISRELKESNLKGKRPEYRISAEYPQIEGSAAPGVRRFNEAVRAFVSKEVAGFRENFTEDADSGGEADISYSVGLANDDLASVEFNLYFFYTGAGRRNSISRTRTFDLKTGAALKLSDLFKPSSGHLKVISDYCLKDLKRQLKEDGGDVPEDEWIMARVEESVDDEAGKWLVTRGGLQVVFDSSQFGPSGAGGRSVTVPYPVLRGIMKPDGLLAPFVK